MWAWRVDWGTVPKVPVLGTRVGSCICPLPSRGVGNCGHAFHKWYPSRHVIGEWTDDIIGRLLLRLRYVHLSGFSPFEIMRLPRGSGPEPWGGREELSACSLHVH